jgi:hypothetical protein
MTHPSTVRRRARAAGEPPQRRGRKPVGEVPKATMSLSLDVSAKANIEAAAAAAGISASALVERWALSLPAMPAMPAVHCEVCDTLHLEPHSGLKCCGVVLAP